MGTVFKMTHKEKKSRIDFFFNPQTFTMAEASSLANNMRHSLGPVSVKMISVNIICIVVCLSTYN